MKGHSKVLTKREWLVLGRVLSSCCYFLAKPGLQETLYRLAVGKTVGFRKFQEWMMLSHLIKGQPNTEWLGTGLSRQTIHKARRELAVRRIMTSELMEEPRSAKRIMLRLNVPGCVKFWLQLYEKRYGPGTVLGKTALGIYEKIVRFYEAEMGWPVLSVVPVQEKVMKIEEAVEEARSKGEEASERRRVKRAGKELKANWIPGKLREFCDELGIGCSATGWTGKDWGSARNWLKYCRQMEIEPRQYLHDLCRCWKRFRRGMKNERGSDIVLPEAVSFPQYFRYRKEIDAWMAVYKDEKEASFTVIDLTERKREKEVKQRV